VITRVWTATDVNGNASTYTQTITVVDTTAPVADVATLADVTAECSVEILTAPTATDNCAGSITGTTTTALPITAQGTTVVTWTYEDANGNISTQTQNVVLTDTTAPVFTTSPADVTVECDGISDPSSTQVVSTQQILPGDYTVIMADSYGDGWDTYLGTGIDVLIDGVNTYNFTCDGSTQTEIVNIPPSVTSVVWRLYSAFYDGERSFIIKDPNDTIIYSYEGDGVDYSQTITPLTFSMPVETVETVVNSGTGVAVATDNCGGDVAISYTDTVVAGTGNNSVITRVWTATDVNGNISTYTQTISVEDSTPPTFTTSPADVTVECDANTTTTALGVAVATDNCDNDVDITSSDVTVAGVGNNSVITRVWTATDDNGNASTYTQTITVVDTTAPTFTTSPESVTVECDASNSPILSGSYTINLIDSYGDGWDSTLQLIIDGVSTSYNCSGSLTTEIIEIPAGTTSVEWLLGAEYYDYERTLQIIDPNGNLFFTYEGLYFAQSVAPEISVTMPGTGTAAATDNCDGDVTMTSADTTVAGVGNNSVITRVWTATDVNGNASTYTQTITVVDTTAPVADVATLADVTAECSVDSLTAPTATDNCAGSITGTTTTVLPITAQGTTVVTWTYEDANGNISTQTQNVVLTDVTAPVFTTSPADVTVECDASTDSDSTGTAAATDNCGGDVAITSADTTVAGVGNNSVITRVWTATDVNGNASTYTQTITVVDTTAPVADVATLADVTAECSVDSLTAPTATDNCAGSITGTTTTVLPITAQGTTVVTWTYEDANGNITTQTQNVVID
jgi:hypothetical protein